MVGEMRRVSRGVDTEPGVEGVLHAGDIFVLGVGVAGVGVTNAAVAAAAGAVDGVVIDAGDTMVSDVFPAGGCQAS